MSVSNSRFGKEGLITGGLGVKTPATGGQEGLGAMPPAANEFYSFHIKKTLILAHFFIEKGQAVMQSLWTMQKYFRSLCRKVEAWLK